MSPLAEGADRLVAEVALELGIDLIVPLPMARDLYIQDFESEASRQEFDSLCERATEVHELPLAMGNTLEQVSRHGDARNKEYAQLGVFLCAHCHILLALWDGKMTGDLGGTAQVVRFHHDDIMVGYTEKTVAAQQMLVDDESDLVYHIVCSRDRSGGAPEEGMEPLDWCWFTKDKDNPRSKELPPQHQKIFARSGEFSLDANKYADEIADSSYPLYSDADKADLPPGVAPINILFCVADVLAIQYQKYTLRTLRISHLLAFLMGFMFILFADFSTQSYYMFAFLVFFAIAAAIQLTAKKRGWHRKYLDYRALAEGLRVQFYWAAAGVTNENASKFAHDNFLQTQDPELGWIRNVMRVAGTRCDINPNTNPAGLDFVLREWIGNSKGGQLGYFSKKLGERIVRNRNTERLGKLSLLVSVSVVITFVVGSGFMAESWADPLMVLMGVTLLLFGIRQGYAYATAEKDLIKQYEFMLRIFSNAHRRLESTDDLIEQRQILRALGGSALDEHAEWILMHRERSIDESEIWRMSS